MTLVSQTLSYYFKSIEDQLETCTDTESLVSIYQTTTTQMTEYVKSIWDPDFNGASEIEESVKWSMRDMIENRIYLFYDSFMDCYRKIKPNTTFFFTENKYIPLIMDYEETFFIQISREGENIENTFQWREISSSFKSPTDSIMNVVPLSSFYSKETLESLGCVKISPFFVQYEPEVIKNQRVR